MYDENGLFMSHQEIPPERFYSSPIKPLPSRAQTPPARPPRAHSTPIKARSAGFRSFSSNAVRRDQAFLQLARETDGRFLGPMPLHDFMAHYLPPSKPMPADLIPHDLFAILTKTEPQMYEKIIDAFQPLSSIKFVKTSENPDNSCDEMRPDIAAYPKGMHNPDQITDFSTMDMWIEVKPTPAYDPFTDAAPCNEKPHKTHKTSQSHKEKSRQVHGLPSASGPSVIHKQRPWFHRKSIYAQQTQGQLVAYANAVFARQFRTRLFSVLICRHYARIILWDHSCAVVTESFNYIQHPTKLAEFFWRYNLLSSDMRGYDPSITTPNTDEVNDAKGALHIEDTDATFVKLSVPEDTEAGAFYIAQTPSYTRRSPMGRCTRGFTAYDVANDKVVWIKDYWRINRPGMEKEGDIYRDLHRHHVPHIPKFERGGDITSSVLCTTSNHQWMNQPWACRMQDITTYSLYRLVLGEVGISLTLFESSWEYVNAIADAVEAHWVAYDRAKILHRDISVGNVLLTADRKNGLLIDWELCKRVPPSRTPMPPLEDRSHGEVGTSSRATHADQQADASVLPALGSGIDIATQTIIRQPDRTGTWQFISVRLLMEPGGEHQLQDDLESFFWVLLWVSLRYTRHNQSPEKLDNLLAAFDEVFYESNEGGVRKRNMLLAREVPEYVHFLNKVLDKSFAELNDMFAVRYKKPPGDVEKAAYDVLITSFSQDHAVIQTHPIYLYERYKGLLGSSLFMLELLKGVVQDRSSWPRDDKATRQVFGSSLLTERKRKSDLDRIESAQTFQSKKYKLNNRMAEEDENQRGDYDREDDEEM